MTLWRVRATLDDRPGFLAVLAASLALRSVNILAVQVHTTEDGAVDDLILDAPDAMTEAELIAAVQRGRGRDAWAVRANARGLVDPPTQVLGLATGLVRDPQALGGALEVLLDASVRWLTEASPVGPNPDRTSMLLPDPAGGFYLAERPAPAFTPAEYARAQALVGLASAADRQAETAAWLLLPDGTELLLRPAEADDLASVTLVAESPTGEVVALGNLIGEGNLAEVALLVEDSWQRCGIGTALLPCGTARLCRRPAGLTVPTASHRVRPPVAASPNRRGKR